MSDTSLMLPASISSTTRDQAIPANSAGFPREPPRAVFSGQNRALQRLVGGEPLATVFAALVEAVEDDLGGEAIAAILLLDRESRCLRHGAAPSLPESYNRAVDGIAIGREIGTCCAAAARNDIVVTVDIENDPGWRTLKKLPLALGLRAAWSMPIRSARGEVLGTFGTYFRNCRAPTALEQEIVGVMAKTAALAIEHRAALEARWENESFLEGIIAASADCIKVLDLDGRVQWISANGLCAMEITDRSAVLGAGWPEFWPEAESREAARSALATACAGGVGRFEGFCPTMAGTPKWWHVEVTAIRDETGTPRSLLSVSRDLTQQRAAQQALAASEERYRSLTQDLEARVSHRTSQLGQANEQLRTEIAERTASERARQQLQRQLAHVEEAERRQLSRELHDEVGQSLSALLVGLQTLQDAGLAAEPAAAIARLDTLAQQVSKEIHDIALALRSSVLDDLGLEHAIAHCAHQWSLRARIAVDLHQDLPASRLPPALESTLYRTVQEALTNVLKHARASQVSIIVGLQGDHAHAIIEDDGVGFDVERPGELTARGQLGLLGMRERALLLGGSVEIQSQPGAGTTVFIRLPVAGEGEQA